MAGIRLTPNSNVQTATINYPSEATGSTPQLQIINSPGGGKGQVQFHSGTGSFSGDNNFIWNSQTRTMSILGNIRISENIIGKYNTNTKNLKITGGENGYLLSTDGTGNISWIQAPATTYGNSNVANYLPTHTGNVSANYFIGNGSQLTGLPASYSNTNVASYLPTYTGNLNGNNVVITDTGYIYNISSSGLASLTTVNVSSNLTTNAIYTDNYFYANGNALLNSDSLINGDNSFVLDNDGNVVFEGLNPGQGINRGLVWDYGVNANGVNSTVRQDDDGITVRAYTVDGGGANGYSAPVNIVTNQDSTEKTWVFDGQGNLTLPGDLRLAAGNIQSNTIAPSFNANIIGINSGNANVIITVASGIFEDPVSGQVTISGVNPPVQANGNWWYQAVEYNQFQLFTDANLTTPADGTTWPGYVDGGTVIGFGLYSDLTVQGGNISVISNDKTWGFDIDGNLTLPGNTFAVNYANGTQVSLGGGGNTGNVTFDDVTVQGVNGLNLSAGADFTANLAYLQVRAGDVASHIHLDTGNNNAYDLILGDDQNYVQVSSTGNILLSAYDSNTAQYTWTLDYNGNLILAGGNSVIQSIANSSLDPINPNVSTMVLTPDANYSSQALVLDPTVPGHIHLRAPGANIDEPSANIFLGGENTSFEITSGIGSVPKIHSNSHTWLFGDDSLLTLPGGNVVIGNQFGAQAIFSNNESFGVVSQGNAATVLQWTDDIANTNLISAVYINGPAANVGDIQIRTGDISSPNVWTFTANSDLFLASGNSVISSLPNNAGDGSGLSTLNLYPDSTTLDDRYLIIDPTGPSHLHLRAGGAQDASNVLLYLGGEQTYVQIDDGYHRVSINSYDIGNTTSYNWRFDYDGTLVAPGNIEATEVNLTGNIIANNIGNITSINLDGNVSNVLAGDGTWIAAGAGGSYGNSDVATFLSNFGSNIINTTGNANVGNLTVASITATANISTTGYFISGNQATGGFQLGNSNSRLKSGDSNSYMTMGQNPAIYPDTAASATAGVLIGGSGYILGPNGGRNITLNYGGTSGIVGLQANVQVGTGGSGTILVPGTITTGVNSILAGPTFTPLANTMAGFVSNVNNYTQLTIQNKSTGADATTDFVATADNGSDTVNYLDLGIINSGYDNQTPTNSLGNIVYAADSYLYAQGNVSNTSQSGGNLAIGTTIVGKSVKIFAGGANSNSVVATISNTGASITGNLTLSGNIIGSSPNVSLVAGSYTATFDNTGVLTLPTNGGDEGGEIRLGIPTANTTLQTRVTVDVFQDRFRIFDGATKGAYIDLSQAATGVGTLLNNRVSGLVNAGTFVTMDNIKATVTSSGNRGLSLAAVSGTFAYSIGGNFATTGGSGGAATTGTMTTTATSSIFNWGFPNTAETSTYILTDTTNNRCYRITLQIGASYNNNSIIIERLI